MSVVHTSWSASTITVIAAKAGAQARHDRVLLRRQKNLTVIPAKAGTPSWSSAFVARVSKAHPGCAWQAPGALRLPGLQERTRRARAWSRAHRRRTQLHRHSSESWNPILIFGVRSAGKQGAPGLCVTGPGCASLTRATRADAASASVVAHRARLTAVRTTSPSSRR